MTVPCFAPVLSCAEAGAWEKKILHDVTAEWAAMSAAGRVIAMNILEDFREIGGLSADARLLVLAGKGNNGGDALLVAATILAQYPQAQAVVVPCFGEASLRPLARRALTALQTQAPSRVELTPGMAALGPDQSYALAVDGIFGYQFRPPIDDATASMIGLVNNHPGIKFRAAVDLPSGIGAVSAPVAFRADFTYAAGIVKTPVLQAGNAASVGRLRYVDLGFFKVERSAGQQNDPDALERVLLPSILEPLAELRAFVVRQAHLRAPVRSRRIAQLPGGGDAGSPGGDA